MKNIRFLLISALAVMLLLGGCAMDTKDSKTISSSSPDTNTGDDNQEEMPYELIRFSANSIEDFTAWIESGGTKEVGMNGELEYPANRQFIELMKVQKQLVFPVVSSEFWLHSVRVNPSGGGYTLNYSTHKPGTEWDEFPQTFDVTFIVRTEEQRQKNCSDVIAESVFSNENLRKSEKQSAWGEYWYSNYAENVKGEQTSDTKAIFLHEEYLVRIAPYRAIQKSPWNPEWFELFDFETVTLK